MLFLYRVHLWQKSCINICTAPAENLPTISLYRINKTRDHIYTSGIPILSHSSTKNSILNVSHFLPNYLCIIYFDWTLQTELGLHIQKHIYTTADYENSLSFKSLKSATKNKIKIHSTLIICGALINMDFVASWSRNLNVKEYVLQVVSKSMYNMLGSMQRSGIRLCEETHQIKHLQK